MKHHTRKPSPSDQVVTIGETTYDQLWAEAIAAGALPRFTEAEGWMSAEQFSKRIGKDIKTARRRLEHCVSCGTFEKAAGLNRQNQTTAFFRPLIPAKKKKRLEQVVRQRAA